MTRKLKRKSPTLRGGKRKCRRCRAVWVRPKGCGRTICDRCRVHCSRCDQPLDKTTLPKVQSTKANLCANCKNEIAVIANNKRSDQRRDWHLFTNYGITLNEYNSILEDQNGVCWICKKLPKERGNRLSVDHKHVKNDRKQNRTETRTRVRGLLCWNCNWALGNFNDDITLLREAANYLEQQPAQKILNKGV